MLHPLAIRGEYGRAVEPVDRPVVVAVRVAEIGLNQTFAASAAIAWNEQKADRIRNTANVRNVDQSIIGHLAAARTMRCPVSALRDRALRMRNAVLRA